MDAKEPLILENHEDRQENNEDRHLRETTRSSLSFDDTRPIRQENDAELHWAAMSQIRFWYIVEWMLTPFCVHAGMAGYKIIGFVLPYALLIAGSSFQYYMVKSDNFKKAFHDELLAEPDEDLFEECKHIHTCHREGARMGQGGLNLAKIHLGYARLKKKGGQAALKQFYLDHTENKNFKHINDPETTMFTCFKPAWFLPKNLIPTKLTSWLIQTGPNYMNVVATAVAAGVAYKEWDDAVQTTWRLRWSEFDSSGHFFTLVAGRIGDYNIPRVLMKALFGNFLVHSLFFRDGYKKDNPAKVADAANLLVIEKVLKRPRKNEQEATGDRGWMLFVKTIMLWIKVSLLAIIYDDLTMLGILSMAQAILSGFSANAQTFERWYHVPLSPVSGPTAIVTMVVFLHFIGIFLCSSHDLSLEHGGCTAFYSAHGAGNNSSSAGLGA